MKKQFVIYEIVDSEFGEGKVLKHLTDCDTEWEAEQCMEQNSRPYHYYTILQVYEKL